MAIVSVRTKSQLETSFVLAPERYDPRRGVLSVAACPALGDIIAPVRRTIGAASKDTRGSCIVLDTCDANEGIVISRKEPVLVSQLGSTKKVVEPGDVIISRLRPYLRQVAYVDDKIRYWSEDILVACSTEFYVLRSPDERSIAFIVPLLLSEAVQSVLAASQEGGHHPRFDESMLLSLPVPESLLDQRDTISDVVEECAKLYRESEQRLVAEISRAQCALAGGR